MASGAIKVLPTRYAGVNFRSRTEARWAVFFQTAGIEWTYEPEGFDLAGERYLPDFHLPQFPLWFEVKPDVTDGAEKVKFRRLCVATKTAGIIAYGAPRGRRKNLFLCEQGNPDEGGLWEWNGPFELLEDRRDDGVYWCCNYGELGCGTIIGGPGNPTDHDRLPCEPHFRPIGKAFDAAVSERFGT